MFEIFIKGKNDATTEFIKLMLTENANQAGIHLKISDKIPLDNLPNQVLDSPLAIDINGAVKSMDKEELIDFFRLVNSTILKERNYGHMKKIIVPIDFSNNSKNAMAYARLLAQSCNGVVKLISVFDNSASLIEEMNYMGHELIQNHKKQLDDFRDQLNADLAKDDWHTPLIESEFRVGNVANSIMNFAEENEDSIIVMGSGGESDFADKIFGTVSKTVAAHSKYPLLIIPPNIVFEPINHLAYCSNDLDLDKEQIFNVLDVVKRCKPHMHLLHVDNDNKDYEAIELLDLLQPNYYPDMVSYDLVFGKDAGQAVSAYCKRKSIGMIALSKRDRSFFERLFHQSFAVEVMQHLKLPLLIVHGNKKLVSVD